MKKLMFVLMAGVMTCVMASCGSNNSTSECANDSIAVEPADTIVAVDSVAVVDSAAVDTLVNE